MSNIKVLSQTQKIVVDPSTSSISVINAGPQGPSAPMLPFLPDTAPITILDADENPIISINADGNIAFGETAIGRDFTNMGVMRPRGQGFMRPRHTSQEPAATVIHNNVQQFGIDEISELYFVRASGVFRVDEMALAPIANDIADITTLSGATLVLREGYDVSDNGGYGEREDPDNPGQIGAAWRTSGTLQVQAGGTHLAELTYTGRNDSLHALTGVTYVPGSLRGSAAFTVAQGTVVYKYLSGPIYGRIHGMADIGRPGLQNRSADWSISGVGDQKLDGYGHVYAAGAQEWGTTAPGPWSTDRKHLRLTEKGMLLFYGTQMIDPTSYYPKLRRFFVTHMNTTTEGFGVQTLPVTNLKVRDPSGFPVPSTTAFPDATYYLEVETSGGTREIGYTGFSAISGEWQFTGCTNNGAHDGETIADNAKVHLSRRNWHTAIGAYGSISAMDLSDALGHASRTTIGAIGPTTTTVATPAEGGLRVGNIGQNDVTLYRQSADTWAMGLNDHMRAEAASGATVMFAGYHTSDTNDRMILTSNRLGFGPGNTAYDIIMKRQGVGVMSIRNGADNAQAGLLLLDIEIDGAINHDGTTIGFYGTNPIVKQTSVAVTAAGVHAALVNLGLIT